jgi:hypothetical protein
MTYFEVVVMYGAILAVARVAWSVLKYAAVAGLTYLHDDVSREYPPEALKLLRRYGL